MLTLPDARAGATPIFVGSRTGAPETASLCLSAASSASRSPPAILQITIDVTSQDSVSAAASEIQSHLSGRALDILVNNAGFMGPESNLLDQDIDEYINTIDVNLIGVYRVTRALLPLMLEGDDGLRTVVFLTSIGATGVNCAGAYSVSKLAVWRFAQFLVLQYGQGENGVYSVVYHPGGVATDLAQGLPEVYRGETSSILVASVVC